MTRFLGVFFFTIVVITVVGFIAAENKPLIVENEKVVVVYHLKGGGLKDFHLKGNQINPFVQSPDSAEMEGQFTVLVPSVTASNSVRIEKFKDQMWDLPSSPIAKNNNIDMVMKGDYLSSQFSIKRSVSLLGNTSAIFVKETIYNYGEKESSSQIIELITLNPAFIKNATIFSNMNFHIEGNSNIKTEIKKSTDSNSFNYMIIANEEKSVALGYVFKSSDFDQALLKNHLKQTLTFISQNSSTLPSKASIEKNYICFLLPFNKDLNSVNSIQLLEGKIVLDTGKKKHEIAPSKGFF